MASLTFMSYADMLFAIVPAAPPTRKNQRTTSCPAPISANVPYQRGSRLIFSALECVSIVSSFTSQQTQPVFRAHDFHNLLPILRQVRFGASFAKATACQGDAESPAR